MVLKRCRAAQRPHDGLLVIAKAAFRRIGNTQVQHLPAAGPMSGQGLGKLIGGEVPVGAAGEHALIIEYMRDL